MSTRDELEQQRKDTLARAMLTEPPSVPDEFGLEAFKAVYSDEFRGLTQDELRHLTALLAAEHRYLAKLTNKPPLIRCAHLTGNRRCDTTVAVGMVDWRTRTPQSDFLMKPLRSVFIPGSSDVYQRKDDPSYRFVSVSRRNKLPRFTRDPRGEIYMNGRRVRPSSEDDSEEHRVLPGAVWILPVRVKCHRCSHDTVITLDVLLSSPHDRFRSDWDMALAQLLRKNYVATDGVGWERNYDVK